MSCQTIKMKDGSVVIANVKTGETLTEEDKAAIAEYVLFCHERNARKRNASLAQAERLRLPAFRRTMEAQRKRSAGAVYVPERP